MNKETINIDILEFKVITCRAEHYIYFSKVNSNGVVITNGPLLNKGKVNYEAIRGFIDLRNTKSSPINPLEIHCKDCPLEIGCKIVYGKNGTIYSSQNSDTLPPETPKAL